MEWGLTRACLSTTDTVGIGILTLPLCFPGLLKVTSPTLTICKDHYSFSGSLAVLCSWTALPTSLLNCSLPSFRQFLAAPPSYTKLCLSGQNRVVISPPFLKTCLARLSLSSRIYLGLQSDIFYHVELCLWVEKVMRVFPRHCCRAPLSAGSEGLNYTALWTQMVTMKVQSVMLSEVDTFFFFFKCSFHLKDCSMDL